MKIIKFILTAILLFLLLVLVFFPALLFSLSFLEADKRYSYCVEKIVNKFWN